MRERVGDNSVRYQRVGEQYANGRISVSPSVRRNYDVNDPFVLVTIIQWRDAVITLGCSLLLIQQRYRLCRVQEEHRMAFGPPIKKPSKNVIDIARGRAVEYDQRASRRVAEAPKGK